MFKKLLTTFVITLMTTLGVTLEAHAKSLDVNYMTSLDVFLSMQPEHDYAEYLDEYMGLIQPGWSAANLDEFEKPEALNHAMMAMKKRLATVAKRDILKVGIEASFKDYDFDKQAFEFKPLNGRSFVDGGYAPQRMSHLPNNIRYMFINPDAVDGFKMDKEKAKAFLAPRKTGNGIDRDIRLDLYIQAIEPKMGTQTFIDTTLMAKIVSYQIRDIASGKLLYEKQLSD